ncbi:MAG: hypothetical protein KAH56_05440 [Candidatus Krumholzibacteria bacterium]|nr:hypothetical protein [Candidatus Krumholzibacteria bacterium]
MKLLTVAFLFSSMVLASASGVAWAGPFFLKAHGGFSLFNPDDVNDALDRFNEAAGGPFLDHIGTGLDVGLSAGYSLNDELGLGLGYSRLSGSSGFSWDGYLFEYDLPADLYEMFLDYLPANDRKFRVGAGTSLGMIRSAAALRAEDPAEGNLEIPFSGVGFLFTGSLLVDAALSPAWSLYGQAGFRHAIINELKVDGEVVFNPDSLDDKLRFNYSGLFLRVGVQFRP